MRNWVGNHLRIFLAGLATLATLVSALGWAIPSLRDWFLVHGGLGWLIVVVLAAALAAQWAAADQTRRELQHLRGQATPQMPSARDIQLFDKILSEWAWGSGPLDWLQNGFNAKYWSQDRSVAIHNSVEDWRERYFDDSEVQRTFEDLRDALGRLSSWMGTYSFPDKNNLADWHYEVPDGDQRNGGWPEFDRVRGEGIAHAGGVVEARRELERVGRQRGL